MDTDATVVGHARGGAEATRRLDEAAGLRPLPTPRWKRTRALLIATDLVSFTMAGIGSVVIGSWLGFAVRADMLLELAPLLALFVLAYLVAGLYPAAGVGPVEELKRITVITSTLFGVLLATLYLAGTLGTYSRGGMLLGFAFALVAVPVARATVRHCCAHRAWFGMPAVMLGAGRTAEVVLERLARKPGQAIKPIAAFDDDPAKIGTFVHGVPVLGPVADAAAFGTRGRIRHAVLAMPGIEPARLVDIVHDNTDAFAYLVMVPNLFGVTSTAIETRDIDGIIGLHVKQNLLLRRNLWIKRALDLALLVPATIIALPVILLGAAAIIVADRGNPFYAQSREGRGGKPFRVWKLRSMYRDADAMLERHLAEDPDAKDEWVRYYKLSHDPRVLPVVGPLLRRASLDELPQLWNILRGEMSFVGPRPFPHYHIERFSDRFRTLRAKVPPGLTGYWQVESRSTADLEAQERLDTHYIHNWSIWMDIYLLARTPGAVMFGGGAY